MAIILKKYQTLLLILLCYITVFAFYPSIKANFTCVDDAAMVTTNPYITSMSIENIKKAFTSYYFKLYHPIVTLSYMLEHKFFQKDPYIYHLDNLLLHLFNVLIVFFIFKKLTKSIPVAYFEKYGQIIKVGFNPRLDYLACVEVELDERNNK